MRGRSLWYIYKGVVGNGQGFACMKGGPAKWSASKLPPSSS